MRVVQNTQMHIGEVDVSQIALDHKSRDDIPQILRGLQHLYRVPHTRTKLFQLLESEMAPQIDKRNGRPGMTLWSIFVCGVLRLDLNIDYDRLQELVNQHRTIREMLGHGLFDPESYHYQTLKDNVSLLFTPELLDKINQIVVETGHELVKKRPAKPPAFMTIFLFGIHFFCYCSNYTFWRALLRGKRKLQLPGAHLNRSVGRQSQQERAGHFAEKRRR